MPALAHTSSPCPPVPGSLADWLPIHRAVELTGRPARTLRWSAVNRWSPRGLAEFRPPPSGKGKPTWWIHRSVDAALSRCPDRATRSERLRASLLTKYDARHVERAYRKFHWLQQWRSACAKPRAAGRTERSIAEDIVAEARRVEGEGFKVSVRSLEIWRAAYDAPSSPCPSVPSSLLPAGIEGLIDKYNGPCADGAEPDAPRSAEAIDSFYELYRTENRLSVRTCHQVVARDAKREGWSWSPSYAATAAWLRKTDDLSTSFLMREGVSTWSKKFMPHNETDWTTVEPGEFYVCDHAQCDFWVWHGKKQIRPWLTAIQDCRSRMIVGWHLGPAPHQDAILSALRMAFRDRAIPRVMRIDNGKDFTSKLLTGITKRERDQLRREYGRDWQRVIRRDAALSTCDDSRWLGVIGELGIELIYAIPYSPWSKGTIERWFGTFHDQHGKTYATYCGNSAVTRPECLAEIKRGYTSQQRRAMKKQHGFNDWMKEVVLKFVDRSAVPTLDEARVRVGDYLDVYHAAAHRGQGMKGQSPRVVWSQAVRLRRAAEDELLFLMDIRPPSRVGGNGVRITVGGASIGYGARAAPLRKWAGRDVLIALDGNDLSQCWALDPGKRTLIARLEANKLVPAQATTDDAREAIAEGQRDKKVMRQAARSSARRTRTATERIAAKQRERAVEARATGTDEVTANILPVRTGFEGVSRPARSPIDTSPAPWSDGSIDDLLGDEPDEPQTTASAYDADDMADLFITDDDAAPETAGAPMDDLFDDDDGDDAPDDSEPLEEFV